MHRPDHSTADPDGISAGVPGYTEGDATAIPSVPRTIVTKDQANEWTEGMCRLVEDSGLALVKGDYDQVRDATRILAFIPAMAAWTAKTNDGAFAGTFNTAIWTGSQFLVAGTSGNIQSSTYGHTWSAETSAGSHTETFRGSVVLGANVYLCTSTGSGGRIDSRPVAGGSWTLVFDGAPIDEDLYCLASNGTILLAGGEDETAGNVPIILRGPGFSPDTMNGGVTSQRIVDLIYDGTEFIALGRTAASGYEVLKFAASEWSVVASGSETVDKIHYDAVHAVYMLAGVSDILTSADAETWSAEVTQLTSGSSVSIAQWETIVIVGTSGTQVQMSRDGGTTWARVDIEASASSIAMAASDERIIGAGSSGYITASGRALF